MVYERFQVRSLPKETLYDIQFYALKYYIVISELHIIDNGRKFMTIQFM
jgi:hypothetical protein